MSDTIAAIATPGQPSAIGIPVSYTHLLQRHIEGVLAGHGRVAVAVVAAALLGVVPVDGADAALPRLVACLLYTSRCV